jgi:hypothetical protein
MNEHTSDRNYGILSPPETEKKKKNLWLERSLWDAELMNYEWMAVCVKNRHELNFI